MSLHRVVRPHTTSHAASRVRPRGKCGFLRAALQHARWDSRRVRACQTCKTGPTGQSLCCSRDCYATQWRNITARARVGAKKWLSNGAHGVYGIGDVSVLHNPRGTSVEKTTAGLSESSGLLIKQRFEYSTRRFRRLQADVKRVARLSEADVNLDDVRTEVVRCYMERTILLKYLKI